MNPSSYRVAARFLAEQTKSAPKKVDDLFKEVKEGNPSYSEEQAWATAWSIYCKHVDPNGSHCNKSPGEYLKKAVSEDDLKASNKAKKTIHEWSSELSDFAGDMEKFKTKVDGWRGKIPDEHLRYYERVDDDLIAATTALDKAVGKLRKVAHDLGGG